MRYALAVLLIATPAAAAEQSALGMARSVSLMTAVENFCPNIIPTDRPLADRYADSFAIVGRKMAGSKAWRALVVSEGKRRLAEVQITGPQNWCENQRRYLREIGAEGVFP